MSLKSAIAAFSMFSRIPMPHISWDEESTRWLLCWFPSVGAVISAAVYVLWRGLLFLGAGALLTGALLTAIPILITGGIHLDGFLDTVDARASCAERERRLEILKDPHVGAFAVIFGGLYLLVSAGAWSGVSTSGLRVMLFVFPLERVISALLALRLPDARQGGSLAKLKGGAGPDKESGILLAEGAGILFAMLAVCRMAALPALAALALTAVYYRHMTLDEFGGVTGDLAGWFLQTGELAALLCSVLAAGFYA